MSAPVPTSRYVVFFAIVLGGLAFDLITKAWVFASVGPPPFSAPVPIIPDVLEFRTSHNSGALWGFGRELRHSSLIFAVLSLLASAAILFWLFVRRAAADRWLTIALALIMAGALGNCHDRLVFGYVRDFVYFHIDAIGFECAIFNFADNFLVAGAIMLMILVLRPDPPQAESSDEGASPHPMDPAVVDG